MRRLVIAVMLAFALARIDIIWGGDSIELHETDRGATIEFDCGRGTIDAALAPDANGRFERAGTFTPERPGPTRDDGPSPLPATYSGAITADAMTLHVTIKTTDAPATTTYELARGREGRVRKCR